MKGHALPIASLLLAILTAPVASHAQQSPTIPHIALVQPGLLSPSSQPIQAFRQGLRELGYVEGQNIAVDYRFFPADRDDLLREIASELVRERVDLIVTAATPPTRAVKQVTSTIPIVMVAVGDPVGTGFVASLARPGGNLTGLTNMSELAGKRLQLLKDLAPKASRVAILWNPTNVAQLRSVREAELATHAFGMTLHSVGVRTPSDFEGAFSEMIRARDDVLMVEVEPLIWVHRTKIADLALKSRLPTIYSYRELVDVGGLMSYAPSLSDLYRRAATYVDKILKGAKPADLPVERPTKFELVINLKSAKALGLTIPESLLVLADEVIR